MASTNSNFFLWRKVVIKIYGMRDSESEHRVMKIASKFLDGDRRVESLSANIAEQTLTVIGNTDAFDLIEKLNENFGEAEYVSVEKLVRELEN